VVQADLIDPVTEKLVPEAFKIFNEWFDKYSTPEGVMTPESTVGFILGATWEQVTPDDNRIKTLFSLYDEDKDGKLQRHEFINFY
jgi:hypothetical protein